MFLALVIAGSAFGLYLMIGSLLTLLDWIDRRRNGSIRLGLLDTCLCAIAWPLLIYWKHRGLNLDNT